MANELTHKTVGTAMSQAEFEATDSHIFNSQAQGDIPVATSATQISRLALGTSGKVLKSNGTDVAYSTSTLIDSVERLPELHYGGTLLHIPTNAGWSTSLVGSGVVYQLPDCNWVKTAATANSTALAFTSLYGFGSTAAAFYYRYDFSKKSYFTFVYALNLNDAHAVRRVQIKGAETIGAMATKGFGIRADNLTLVGESYNTALGELDLATALTVDTPVLITIIHYPATPKIEWYVNGTIKGTQSTANTIPVTADTNTSYLVHSILKGNDADDDSSFLCQPKLWRA